MQAPGCDVIGVTPPANNPDIEGTNIYSGKKTDLERPQAGSMNLAASMGRMAFSHIPVANIWEMDGAGTQINLGTRGSDAHRSIKMNMRQNWNFLERYHVSVGVNNIANAEYFTRRITMYPGSGILPADGRTGYVGLGIVL